MNKILWMPIDIPKFPLPDLDINPKDDWGAWSFFRLTDNEDFNPYVISKLKSSVDEKLVEWFKEFPYTSIRNIKFNIQKEAVTPHIDFTNPSKDLALYTNNQNAEPCGYRILIRGSRNNKLYVVHENKKIYVTMPEDTDVYVLGHTSTIHGVDDEPGRATLFTHFEIDIEKHNSIIERSLFKYKDYAVIV